MASLTPLHKEIVIAREFYVIQVAFIDLALTKGYDGEPEQATDHRAAEENETAASADLISCISGSALTLHPFLVRGLFSPAGEESRRATKTAAPEYLAACRQDIGNAWRF